jgi:plasmid stabilization system protein ParE
MIRYEVQLTDAALAAIGAQARYIAEEVGAPLNAQRWLEQVWDAVDSLERFPRRGSMAEEDAYVEYEVRQLIVDSHLLLFTVDDEQRRVWIIGLRHGHRLPRPRD